MFLKTLKHTKTMTKNDDKDFILQLFLQHKYFTKHNYLSVVLFLVSFVCLLVKPPNNLQFLHLWYYSWIIRTQFFDNRNCIICCWQITQGQATFSNSDIPLQQTYVQKYETYQYLRIIGEDSNSSPIGPTVKILLFEVCLLIYLMVVGNTILCSMFSWDYILSTVVSVLYIYSHHVASQDKNISSSLIPMM